MKLLLKSSNMHAELAFNIITTIKLNGYVDALLMTA